jgi:nitrite reductase (NADH) small subunit
VHKGEPSATVTSGGGPGPGAASEAAAGARWVAICPLAAIVPDTGVAALIDGKQVAVFRVGRGSDVYALQNFDPFSKAFVLSRGIVGDRGGVAKVASPIFKQSFDLATGRCLDDAAVSVRAYPARVTADGQVEILFAVAEA